MAIKSTSSPTKEKDITKCVIDGVEYLTFEGIREYIRSDKGVQTIKKWAAAEVFVHHWVGGKTGKTLFFRTDCVMVRSKVREALRIERMEHKKIGKECKLIFGDRDSALIQRLNSGESPVDIARQAIDTIRKKI